MLLGCLIAQRLPGRWFWKATDIQNMVRKCFTKSRVVLFVQSCQSYTIWKSSKGKLKRTLRMFCNLTKIRGDPMPIIVLNLLYLTQFRAARRDQVRLSFNIENALEIWHSLVRLMCVCGAWKWCKNGQDKYYLTPTSGEFNAWEGNLRVNHGEDLR